MGQRRRSSPQFAGVTSSHGYLSQGALHGPQEVGIAEAVVPRADVVQLKAEPLDLLKVVVHQEDLGEDRTAAAADHLCAVHLRTHTHTRTHRREQMIEIKHAGIDLNKVNRAVQGFNLLNSVLEILKFQLAARAGLFLERGL